MSTPMFLGRAEACAFVNEMGLSMSLKTFERQVQSRVGAHLGRRWFVAREALDAFLKARFGAHAPATDPEPPPPPTAPPSLPPEAEVDPRIAAKLEALRRPRRVPTSPVPQSVARATPETHEAEPTPRARQRPPRGDEPRILSQDPRVIAMVGRLRKPAKASR